MTIQLSNELNPIFPFPTTLLGILDEKAGKISWGKGRQEDEHLKIDMQNYMVVCIDI